MTRRFAAFQNHSMGAIVGADYVSTLSVKRAVGLTGIGKYLFLRWAGAWIDLLILFFFLAVPDWTLGNARYQETFWIWLIAPILYFPVLEGIWGRTIGKLVTGTMVVDISGKPPGIWKAVVRTILRIVEVNPLTSGGGSPASPSVCRRIVSASVICWRTLLWCE